MMNPEVNYIAQSKKVAPDTEDFYNEDFWNSLSIVIGAVDNILARKYIDYKCVWHRKPYLESGTLGAKCHSSVILPHMT